MFTHEDKWIKDFSNFQTFKLQDVFKLSNFQTLWTFKLSNFQSLKKDEKLENIEFESLKFEKYFVGRKYKKIESLKVWNTIIKVWKIESLKVWKFKVWKLLGWKFESLKVWIYIRLFSYWFSNFQTVQTFKLSIFQTFKLSKKHHVFKLQNFKLSNFELFKLSNFQTLKCLDFCFKRVPLGPLGSPRGFPWGFP